MKSLYLRKAVGAISLCMALTATAQENVAVKTGAYSPDWENLEAWECPEWFKNAKFGIWAHWGPQCEAESGDWYARHMYFIGEWQYNTHVQKYGDPSEFGLKDLCNAWKAENWNPDALVKLYHSVGAKYFMTLGQHHDNFDLWNSPYQEWNSVNIGPKRDIVGEWAAACDKYGLPLGVSMHGSHSWTWLEGSQDFDGNLTKADGKGKWWEGYDPQELYAQQHEPSLNYTSVGMIHSQWEWGNGASLPSEAYKTKFQNRVLECINSYNPDMLYFDDTVLPFYGCDDAVGLNILSHYYNHSAEQNGGEQQVVVMGKKLETSHKRSMLWDVERGIPDRPQEDYWQTCTCIGSWHYDQGTYERGGYKSAQQVVDMLIDIVSKNGNLLLSVPMRGDGTIDEKEMAVLEGIKAWMDINGTSIYGTRPWKNFGEGPLAEASNPLNSQGFNENNNYSDKDVRFVERNDTVFATIMRWPAVNKFTFASFGMTSKYYSGEVKKVTLLGYGEVPFVNDIDGLTVTIPEDAQKSIAPVFAVEFDENSSSEVSLEELISLYEQKLAELRPLVSGNTGKWNRKALDTFAEAIATAKTSVGADDVTVQRAVRDLNNAYSTLKETGLNQGTAPDYETGIDVTVDYLDESANFSTTVMGTRFGTPQHWTVENYYVPQNDASKGVKNGVDLYDGAACLSLGVWAGEDAAHESDLQNARIYRKVTLEAGRYYFGAAYNANYQLSQAYIFASGSLLTTNEIPDNAIAYESVSKAGKDMSFRGIWFTLEEDQDVYLGFQADLANGSGTQEFRAQEIVLLYHGTMDFFSYDELRLTVDGILEGAIINNNTGFHSREAADALRAVLDEAWEVDEDATPEQLAEAYTKLDEALQNFLQNGRNPGGVVNATGSTDISAETFGETSAFSRLDESVTTRFATPRDWTVENFYIPNGGDGTKNGLDRYPGFDCLMLGIWNDKQNNLEGDISEARIYRTVHLKPGRYFFGAEYQTTYGMNDQAYIFVSNELLPTEYITTESIAWYQVNKTADGSKTTDGLYFYLDEEQDVVLGWQINLNNGNNAQEMRVKSVSLLYYGEINIDKLQTLVADVENALGTIKINENTGHYSADAYAVLLPVIEKAKAVKSTDDYAAINNAYQQLSEAFTEFVNNGRNPGGQPDDIDATDITVERLSEKKEFARADKNVTDRFASPLHWTVENYEVQSNSEGVRGGLDKWPGFDCLTLGVWDDKQNAATDLTNARIYQKVTLEAGRYYFGGAFNALYNMNKAYFFVSEQPLDTDEIETNSVAWYDIMKCKNDGKMWGVYFTLEEDTEVLLGVQADLAGGANAQEFRISEVALLRYGTPTSIEDIIDKDSATWDESQPMQYYSITGMQLSKAPAHGLFIIRQAGKAWKVYIP